MIRIDRRKTILVADDEPIVRTYLELALTSQGYRVKLAEDGQQVLDCLAEPLPEIALILLDLLMPRLDGLETLRRIRRTHRHLPVIVVSGTSSTLHAAEVIKAGANDFLPKPVSRKQLGEAVAKALNGGEGAAPETEVRREHSVFCFGSAQRQRIEASLDRIAASELPVLLEGETGVGKEVVARRLHARSKRADKPFLKVNCAALPADLVESELFGYERGAFTGAFRDKPGKFELADGGTILLDEIGDMDYRLQAKLLQVLQDHEFQRLGGRETVRVNVRIMAATHRDLEKAIAEGQFRQDLYYRLNVMSLSVPPLRECPEDIPRIARFLLSIHAADAAPPDLSPALRDALMSHDWPGNIRELENLMRKLLVFGDQDVITQELIAKRSRGSARTLTAPPPHAIRFEPRTMLKKTETDVILWALRSTRWNRKQAAQLLNVSYKPFLYKLRKLGIEAYRAEEFITLGDGN